ncbi:beta-ketoacyl synthase N-terminal-like domain-containing protein [Moorena sp. SIO3F7]|uniref:beta-ketoacyl synthase N-terminal-like domain-containing protein n=1 Tax=unclassified Moorena TaxID=2683338 RepID=UPI00344BEE40
MWFCKLVHLFCKFDLFPLRSWEAMENDGHIPQRLQGESTGVFVGITVNDYKNR